MNEPEGDEEVDNYNSMAKWSNASVEGLRGFLLLECDCDGRF